MARREVVTLTTDFGDEFSLAQLKLIIAALNEEIRVVTVSNDVAHFSVIEGAFVLSKAYKLAPPGSVHIGVVDPDVGSERLGLLIQTRNHWFVGPDNGLLYPAAVDDGIVQVYRLDEDRIDPTRSNTFHGRDIFARAAGLLTQGIRPEEFSVPISATEIVPFEFAPYQVVHIDSYGNIKLSSEPDGFRIGDRVVIEAGNTPFEAPFCRTFTDVSPGDLLVYEGSHQTLEIAKRLGSAAGELKVNVTDVLSLRPINEN